MTNVLIIITLLVLIYWVSSDFRAPGFLSKLKKTAFEKGMKTKGSEMKFIKKTCDICHKDEYYLEGEDTDNLKWFTITDPDSDTDISKLCCKECFEKLKAAMEEKKSGKVEVSDEIRRLMSALNTK